MVDVVQLDTYLSDEDSGSGVKSWVGILFVLVWEGGMDGCFHDSQKDGLSFSAFGGVQIV
jgi:hypothetical protein